MTTYTQTDLAIRMLRDLGLVAAEETPSAADLIWAKETIEAEVTTMSADRIRLWGGSYSSIPGEYMTPLSRRIGLAVAPSFGLLSQAQALAAMPEAEKVLRKISSTPPSGERQESEYF